MRALLFPDAAPRYSRQYCWRVNAPRDAVVTQPHFFMGGQVTAGLMPVSDNQMYMWLLHPEPARTRLADAALPGRLREIMAPSGGLLGTLRDGLGPHSTITVRPLEAILMPRP